jgi:hypothetical protein
VIVRLHRDYPRHDGTLIKRSESEDLHHQHVSGWIFREKAEGNSALESCLLCPLYS